MSTSMILMAVCGLVATLAMVPTANAWMGSMYRNREALRPSDYDEMPFYRPGNPMPRTGMWYQQRRSALNLPEDDPQDISSSCKGYPCQNDEGCCETMICQLPEPENKKVSISATGTCIPNPNEGVACKQDATCGLGMECILTAGSRGFKTCQPKTRDTTRKQYNDDCRQSMECDQGRGLCCQVHRRHRQPPRQVCLYYKELHDCAEFRKDYMPNIERIPNLKNKWWQY